MTDDIPDLFQLGVGCSKAAHTFHGDLLTGSRTVQLPYGLAVARCPTRKVPKVGGAATLKGRQGPWKAIVHIVGLRIADLPCGRKLSHT